MNSARTDSNPSFVRRANLLLATGFGSGYFPIAPGTVGSAAAVIVYLPIHPLLQTPLWPIGLLFLLCWIALSIQCSSYAERYFGKKDDGRVVIDEFAGQWISLYLLPFTLTSVVAAFFLFRVMDVLKPYPANASQKLRGGLGIVMDDVIAGVYTNILLQILFRLIL